MCCDSLSMAQDPIRYLALGDSYTIGESVDPADRWPVQLAERLKDTGIIIDEPVIIARTGWTTGELSSAIDESGIKEVFDLVTLLIGVNNQYRGYDTASYRSDLIRLIERAVGFAGGDITKVILVSIPDWGVMPFAEGRDRDKIAAEINTFNDIMRTEAESVGVSFINITPVSRTAAVDPEMAAVDGLHPSGKMYSKWVDLVLPVARGILGN